MRCLLAILAIDRDADLAPLLINACLDSIECAKEVQVDILVITRETDILTRVAWSHVATVLCVPHYDIHARHAIQHVAAARNTALQMAHEYAAVWFVDTDVLPHSNTLSLLWKSEFAVVGAPYRVRWCGFPAVGIIHDTVQSPLPTHCNSADEGQITLNGIASRLRIVDATKTNGHVHAMGFGCTLIRKEAFHISCDALTVFVGDLNSEHRYFAGEDVGFFFRAFQQGLKVGVLPTHEVPHLYDRSYSQFLHGKTGIPK